MKKAVTNSVSACIWCLLLTAIVRKRSQRDTFAYAAPMKDRGRVYAEMLLCDGCSALGLKARQLKCGITSGSAGTGFNMTLIEYACGQLPTT